eukprot:TRINITY_DN4324_c0_g7_i1.p1 TRINITY_DN4324_c0_g7~~TRINITY_DN4324_c0_g7_i1.p1  ORF type:complete len:340 (+),score=-31.53 TRINITY_DN4324_c0_g7_i1:86-1105(+)
MSSRSPALQRLRIAAAGKPGDQGVHPWLVLHKPHGLPFYTSTQLQYGLFAASDDTDSVASRLIRQVDALKTKVSNIDEDDRQVPVTFPLPSQSWFSRGATLAATTPEADAFLAECDGLGAVLRRYHVLCRVPRCVTTRQAIEEAAAAATKSTPKIINPSLAKAIIKKRVAREVGASSVDGTGSVASVPTCISRHTEVRGSILDGRLIKASGTMIGAFASSSMWSASDSVQRSQRLSSLFVPKASYCEPNCACESQRHVFGSLSTKQPVVVPVPIGSSSRVRPVSIDFTLLRYDKESQLALFDATTATASEAHIRCAFAANGFPVLHDPDFDAAFSRTLR